MAVIEAIQTQHVQVPAGVTNIEFTGFPSTYRNLQLRVSTQTVDTGASEDHLEIRFATTGSYSWQVGSTTYTAHGCGAYNGNNVTTESYNGSGGATITCGRRGFAGTYAGSYEQYGRNFAAAVIDIADYSNTTMHKTVRTMSLGWSSGSRGVIGIHSGIFKDNYAITGVQIYARSGAYLAMGTVATLYGMNS